jgi:hypothetical protein
MIRIGFKYFLVRPVLLPFGFGLLGIVLGREIGVSCGHGNSREVGFSAIIYCIFIAVTLAIELFLKDDDAIAFQNTMTQIIDNATALLCELKLK